jgi:tetratricopeptide (TPR) repeat protein
LFQGNNNLQIIFKHINERPPLFKTVAPEGTEIKPELERIVMQTLEKEPENRYQNCDDLAKDLMLVASGKNPVKEASQARKLTRAFMQTGKLLAFGLVAFIFMYIANQAVASYNQAHIPEYIKLAQKGLHEKAEGKQNYPAAELYFETALKSAIKAGDVPASNGIALVLGQLYDEDGDPQDAAVVLKEAIGRDAGLPANDVRGKLHDEYSGALHLMGQNAEAEKEAAIAYEVKSKWAQGKPDVVTKHALDRLYAAQYAQGKFADAEKTAEKAVAELKAYAKTDHHPDAPDTYDKLGRAALRNGQVDTGVENGMKALNLNIELFGATSRPAKDSAAWYAHELDKAGRAENAKAFLDKVGLTKEAADQRYRD